MLSIHALTGLTFEPRGRDLDALALTTSAPDAM
jgi:hypothetical protein